MAGDVSAVPSVDLARYAGDWFEIARLPNRFQNKCESNTTASYTLRPDGKIDVLNQCRTADGGTIRAKGTAKLADAKGPNSKLRVTFFWPFYGDYWVLALDPEYRWALVGEPSRKYLWILARAPRLDEATYDGIVRRAASQGFPVDQLMRTPQR